MMSKTYSAGALSLVAIAAVSHGVKAQETQMSLLAHAGTVVMKVHAVGAQIYDCKPDPSGTLTWQFREPIATLLSAGKTIGRHFAGPSWEMADGSAVVGTVTAKVQGTAPGDIPWLTLSVSDRRGAGLLDPVATIQRINTSGGVRSGPCPDKDALIAEPYAADYVFTRP